AMDQRVVPVLELLTILFENDSTAEEPVVAGNSFYTVKKRAGTAARCHELGYDIREFVRIRINWQATSGKGVIVSRKGDGIADAFFLQEGKKFFQLSRITLPRIRPDIAIFESGKGNAREVEPHLQGRSAIHPDAPFSLRGFHDLFEPRLLRSAHLCAGWCILARVGNFLTAILDCFRRGAIVRGAASIEQLDETHRRKRCALRQCLRLATYDGGTAIGTQIGEHKISQRTPAQ